MTVYDGFARYDHTQATRCSDAPWDGVSILLPRCPTRAGAAGDGRKRHKRFHNNVGVPERDSSPAQHIRPGDRDARRIWVDGLGNGIGKGSMLH